MSKIRSNTCNSTCRLYFMFTLEKTSNDEVPCNFRELLNKYLWWSRSRAKVTAPAPAPAKYPGSGRLRLRNPDRNSWPSPPAHEPSIPQIRQGSVRFNLSEEEPTPYPFPFLCCILILWPIGTSYPPRAETIFLVWYWTPLKSEKSRNNWSNDKNPPNLKWADAEEKLLTNMPKRVWKVNPNKLNRKSKENWTPAHQVG